MNCPLNESYALLVQTNKNRSLHGHQPIIKNCFKAIQILKAVDITLLSQVVL